MQQLKKELRRELIQKRRELSAEKKAIDDLSVFGKLIGLPCFKSAERVLAYVSTQIEVDTLRLIDYCLEAGKEVAVPQCVGENMIFRLIKSRNQLRKGAFGIMEPDDSLPAVLRFENSVCIVPALRFNKDGQRLGYGKGFYDRFLEASGCFSIGICYEDFMGDFPAESHDKAVDIIVTDRRIYERQSAKRS